MLVHMFAWLKTIENFQKSWKKYLSHMSLSCAWWKRYFFHHFPMFVIFFDHANACASARSLVEIHNRHLFIFQSPYSKGFWNEKNLPDILPQLRAIKLIALASISIKRLSITIEIFVGWHTSIKCVCVFVCVRVCARVCVCPTNKIITDARTHNFIIIWMQPYHQEPCIFCLPVSLFLSVCSSLSSFFLPVEHRSCNRVGNLPPPPQKKHLDIFAKLDSTRKQSLNRIMVFP